MSMDAAIPQEWAAQILENLNDLHVFASLATREYEGDIKGSGDSVRILSVGRISVSDFIKGSTTITPETPDAASQVLLIDKAKYFAFEISDIDQAQQKPKLMSAYTREAAWSMKDTVDADLAEVLVNGVATANKLTAASSVGTGAGDDNAYDLLMDLKTKLDESNVPSGNRWVTVMPWFANILVKDPRWGSFGTPANLAAIKNGHIGDMAAGFSVHVSNNNNASTLVAGYSGAFAYAEQIVKTEAYRPQDDFTDALKGLLVYGRKVIRPSALASVVVTEAS